MIVISDLGGYVLVYEICDWPCDLQDILRTIVLVYEEDLVFDLWSLRIGP